MIGYTIAVRCFGDDWATMLKPKLRDGHEWSQAHDDFVFQVARALSD